MLTITDPSRITSEAAGFSIEQECISSKHVGISDLIPERKLPFLMFMRKKLIQIAISNLTGNIQLVELLNILL